MIPIVGPHGRQLALALAPTLPQGLVLMSASGHTLATERLRLRRMPNGLLQEPELEVQAVWTPAAIAREVGARKGIALQSVLICRRTRTPPLALALHLAPVAHLLVVVLQLVVTLPQTLIVVMDLLKEVAALTTDAVRETHPPRLRKALASMLKLQLAQRLLSWKESSSTWNSSSSRLKLQALPARSGAGFSSSCVSSGTRTRTRANRRKRRWRFSTCRSERAGSSSEP